MLFNEAGRKVASHEQDEFLRIPCAEDLPALGVNHLALRIHHVVVFDGVLADVEVEPFDLLLRLFDASTHHAVFDRCVIIEAETFHQPDDSV